MQKSGAQNGHVCLPREKLVLASSQLLGAIAQRVDKVIDDMLAMGKLRYSMFDGVVYLYDKYAYECESYIAEKLLPTINRMIPNPTAYKLFSKFLLQSHKLVDAPYRGKFVRK